MSSSRTPGFYTFWRTKGDTMGDFDEIEGHDPALEEVVAEPVKEEVKQEEKPAPKKASDK